MSCFQWLSEEGFVWSQNYLCSWTGRKKNPKDRRHIYPLYQVAKQGAVLVLPAPSLNSLQIPVAWCRLEGLAGEVKAVLEDTALVNDGSLQCVVLTCLVS